MLNITDVFINSFQQLLNQMVAWIPKLVVALIIWHVGKYALALVGKWVKKIDIPKTKIDNKLIDKFSHIMVGVGKILLFLIVLDYLGIGRSVVAAFANGLTLSVAIALGIAFGRALEGEAKNVVLTVKKYIGR